MPQFGSEPKGQEAMAKSTPVVIASDQTPIPVEGMGADTIVAYNVTLTLANTEYSQALPSNCKGFYFRSRNYYQIRFAFETGKVATSTSPFLTTGSNVGWGNPNGMNLSSVTLYFATANAGDVVELLTWS